MRETERYKKNAGWMPGLIILILLLSVMARQGWSQENDILVNTDWDHERHSWNSSWISHPDKARTEYGVFLLRNRLKLNEIPDSLVFMSLQTTVTDCW